MTDQEIRGMIRDSIARHLGSEAAAAASGALAGDTTTSCHAHASHGRFALVRGADDDGACLIEPAVRCNHCGFCQSFGH
jgi:hypothetical protein